MIKRFNITFEFAKAEIQLSRVYNDGVVGVTNIMKFNLCRRQECIFDPINVVAQEVKTQCENSSLCHYLGDNETWGNGVIGKMPLIEKRRCIKKAATDNMVVTYFLNILNKTKRTFVWNST